MLAGRARLCTLYRTTPVNFCSPLDLQALQSVACGLLAVNGAVRLAADF
jgi:hypothetical protein